MDDGSAGELLIATRNAGKRREFERLLRDVFPADVMITDVASWPAALPEVVEDRDTFEGNAIKKAVELSEAAGVCAIAEDSGLAVDALGGAPGVYSARYAGLSATDAENNQLLVKSLRAIGTPPYTARYVAVLCLALVPHDPMSQRLGARLGLGALADVPRGTPQQAGEARRVGDRVVVWWRAEVEGELILEGRGEGGFGYDPHFLIPEWGQTFAEVSPAQKDSISHRYRAIASLRDALTPRER